MYKKLKKTLVCGKYEMKKERRRKKNNKKRKEKTKNSAMTLLEIDMSDGMSKLTCRLEEQNMSKTIVRIVMC